MTLEIPIWLLLILLGIGIGIVGTWLFMMITADRGWPL